MKSVQLHSNRYTNAPFPEFPMTVCSSNDCTGLEPHPAESEDETFSYENIYPYQPNRYVSDCSDMP